MKKVKLPEDYAAVLGLLRRVGNVELGNLIESLRYDRARMLNILRNLQHKGLVSVRRSGYGAWVSLSSKGWRIMPVLLQAPPLAT